MNDLAVIVFAAIGLAALTCQVAAWLLKLPAILFLLLAVIAFEFVVSDQAGAALPHTLVIFTSTLGVGGVLGTAAGYLCGLILRHHLLAEYLHNLATLSLVFVIFAAANHLQEESGLLAVTVMGMWLANMPGVDIRGILNFKETLTLVFISGLFIILGCATRFRPIRGTRMERTRSAGDHAAGGAPT